MLRMICFRLSVHRGHSLTDKAEEELLSKAVTDGTGMTPDTASRIVAWLDKNAKGWRKTGEDTDVQN